jgi:hypothetical protein
MAAVAVVGMIVTAAKKTSVVPGSNACGGGSDGDHDEDGTTGLEADFGTASEEGTGDRGAAF